MKPTTKTILLQILDRAFDQRSWHGSNLAGSVRGVTAELAATRVHGRKTVWEQVLHSAYWKQRVLNVISGAPSRFGRPGSNWPPMPAIRSRQTWREDVAMLHELHRRLRAVVDGLDENSLENEKLVWHIQGAAAHDLYHAGQIKLLRRMIESGRMKKASVER